MVSVSDLGFGWCGLFGPGVYIVMVVCCLVCCCLIRASWWGLGWCEFGVCCRFSYLAVFGLLMYSLGIALGVCGVGGLWRFWGLTVDLWVVWGWCNIGFWLLWPGGCNW